MYLRVGKHLFDLFEQVSNHKDTADEYVLCKEVIEVNLL